MRELPPYMRGISRADMQHPSTIGSVIKNPTIFYGILAEFTRSLFSPDISGPHYPHWDRDVQKTKVWIDTEYEYEAVNPEFRPAVYIWLPEGIKYDRVKSAGARGGLDMRMEEAEYNGLHKTTCTVAWDVIAGTRYESVDLASNLLYLIEAFSKPVMHEFCFDIFEVTGFNSGGIRKEEREKNVCTITAKVSFQSAWTLKLESPKLKKIIMRTGQQLLDVVA